MIGLTCVGLLILSFSTAFTGFVFLMVSIISKFSNEQIEIKNRLRRYGIRLFWGGVIGMVVSIISLFFV